MANERAAAAALKSYRLGTHRIFSPTETLARVRPFMAAMGITRIANVTGLDRVGIPVVVVCRPNSRAIAVAQGKGLTLAAAQASGVMEAIETYHAERIALPLKLGSRAELGGVCNLADVDRLPRIARSRFHDHIPLLWIEGRDWSSGASLWLPYELVHANYTLPFPSGHGCFVASTNGLASGNCLEEAVSHGICEVIERDATGLWRRLSGAVRARTRLDLATVDDPACREVLERYERADVEVAVWETTSDVGVAAFLCLVLDRQREGARPANGKGSHPVREVALLRALTEAAQVRLTYISGARDDIAELEYAHAEREHSIRAYQHWMAEGKPARAFSAVPTWQSDSFTADIDWLLQRLSAVGITQVVVVDLSQPQRYPVAVVRVVIPGLEGPDEHPEYAPGARAQALLAPNPP